MRTTLMILLAGLATATSAPQAPAQNLGQIVRAITDPNDARRHEEEAHRNGRAGDERYWQRYGAGLHEQRAHENKRPDEARYWQQYHEGLR